jgi:hypothetical protein
MNQISVERHLADYLMKYVEGSVLADLIYKPVV